MAMKQRVGSVALRLVAVGVCLAVSALLVLPAHAASMLEAATNGEVTWKAGVNGVEIQFNSDGSVKRLYSKYTHPVSIADRRGIHTATVIAEEKAKAEIVRFLQQEVATGRVVEEVESELATKTQDSAGDAQNVASRTQRAIVQSLTELTASSASGVLRAVVVLESGYDKDLQEAWVVVGISDKTMKAADTVQQLLDSTAPMEQRHSPPPAPEAASRGSSNGGPPSQLRRGNPEF